MSKVIAVYGSPSSGKTTFSLKLAQEVYTHSKSKVIFLSPDTKVPSLPYIFPHFKADDLYSLGQALDKTDIFGEDILKQLVATKAMRNLGYLGFKANDNQYSYPRPTTDKLTALFKQMKELADYIVVDCSTDEEDAISAFALSVAETGIRLVTADLKSIGYFASQAYRYVDIEERSITVLNTTENDVFLPVDEIKAHFQSVSAILPYSRELKRQISTGTLSEKLLDRKYGRRVAEIAKKVI